MIGQKKISAFFSSPSAVGKRKLESLASSDAETTPKKAKSNENSCPNSPQLGSSECAASPDQKKRMIENQAAARLKLVNKACFGILEGFGTSWFRPLEAEFRKEYFVKLSQFVSEERSKFVVYPPLREVFTWTRACTLEEVKVVILGQDPYHGPNQAHGLCFSVKKGVPAPPSLVNMYKELAKDIDGFVEPKHGNLTGWARQGVLLLNACLTVRRGEANSHKDKGWEKFTDAAIQAVNARLSGVVFLLWGSFAQKKGVLIDKKKHHILQAAHPSPLSAFKGFFGCKHFSTCNDLLRKQGDKPIDWSHLPRDDGMEV